MAAGLDRRRLDHALVRLLPAVPRSVVARLASPYVAGPELDDALRVVRRLERSGIAATIAVLGEEASSLRDAELLVAEQHAALDALARERLEAGLSLKLTGLGVRLDAERCLEHLRRIVERAARHKRFVRIDMEDSSLTQATLDIYRQLRREGHENVGIVLQATLRRTLSDASALAGLAADVRLCKGIYLEPPEIAYRGHGELREAFLAALARLLESGARVALATHDDWLIERSLALLERHGLGPGAYELQMLLGVRPDLGRALAERGQQVRVYVPYGRRWYEYSLRRLQENPSLAAHVARDVLRRARSRL